MTNKTEIQLAAAEGPVAIQKTEVFSLRPRDLKEAMQFADIMAKSSMVPKAFIGKPGDILLAVQMGAELGVGPMQAIQGIAVINGRPSVWGDLGVAICRANPEFDDMTESFDEKTQVATCTTKRKGQTAHTEKFSWADAQRAGLAGRDTYKQYPARMLGWRAKTNALRFSFADSLKGIRFVEEEQDNDGRSFGQTTAQEVATTALPATQSVPVAETAQNLEPATKKHDNGTGEPSEAVKCEAWLGECTTEGRLTAVAADIKNFHADGKITDDEKKALGGLYLAKKATLAKGMAK